MDPTATAIILGFITVIVSMFLGKVLVDQLDKKYNTDIFNKVFWICTIFVAILAVLGSKDTKAKSRRRD